MDAELLAKAKSFGFSDRQIANLTGRTEDEVRAERKQLGLVPSYRLVDTCAAEFEAYTPYYYSTYDIVGRIIIRGVSFEFGRTSVHQPVAGHEAKLLTFGAHL